MALSLSGTHAPMARSNRARRLRRETTMTLAWIAGRLQMGSPASEAERSKVEGPQTEVTLTKVYWLGKYEVTQGEYETVMGSNPSRWKGARLPVERVSWSKAMDFCRKLTERERSVMKLPAGYEYRLPTEAQWEYARRHLPGSAIGGPTRCRPACRL